MWKLLIEVGRILEFEDGMGLLRLEAQVIFKDQWFERGNNSNQ